MRNLTVFIQITFLLLLLAISKQKNAKACSGGSVDARGGDGGTGGIGGPGGTAVGGGGGGKSRGGGGGIVGGGGESGGSGVGGGDKRVKVTVDVNFAEEVEQ